MVGEDTDYVVADAAVAVICDDTIEAIHLMKLLIYGSDTVSGC